MSFAPSTVLPCNFRLTLLRNTIKSAAKTHFQSYFVFNNSSVQWLSSVRLFVTPWITAHQASLYITNSQSPPQPMSIESVMPSSHLIFCHPLLLLPPILPSIRVFSNESTLHVRWPKYWSFSFNISPSKEHPGLISFRMDWLHLLAVQGTNTTVQKHQFFGANDSKWGQFSFTKIFISIWVQKIVLETLSLLNHWATSCEGKSG